ncbi:NUDIX domain-containing protein [Maribellus comscasis]|uniref:NUDIX domain-containing protein n=1 Tax=Maribellus comscasis TaxID=2681766 RepID=A0A6I6K9P1_9BACT|nr:NUDIX hydrolase [Maribellus comscasis]QGY46824.1 NUDIX domain-containing protein [Maribellus comscasis]
MYTYQYPRAALTTDAIVFVREKNSTFVLLIERGREPFKNKWALPGGFIEMDETLEQACIRELEEETGLKVEKITQFKTYDAIDRDPRHRTISVVHSVELKEKEPVKGSDDAAHAAWFPIDDLPELGFDHQQILNEFFELSS